MTKTKENKSAASFNVAILPDEATTLKAIELSRKISSQFDTYFTLDGKLFLPHITLYQAHFPLKNLEKLKRASENVARVMKNLEISIGRLSIALAEWVSLTCENKEELRFYHQKIVEFANPLREGLIMPQLADRNLRLGDEDDIKNFGSLLIGPRYQPHITITRLRLKNPSDSAKILETFSELPLNFKPKSVILGDLGEHGTVTRIISEFKL